jgi:membrane-associated phospholipid phosphatase
MSSSSAIYSGKSRTLTPVPVRQLVAGMAPMLLLYFLYTVVRFLVKDRGPVEGIRNSYRVLHLEERLGFDWEVSLQEYLLPHEWLVKAANWYYVIGFLPVILACASIAALLDFQTFLWWRKRFALTLLLALVGFALYPLAPPRMLPGMVDTLMVYGPQYYGDSHGSSLFNAYGRLPSMVNVYAAMPSMHVAWSIIAGALLVSAFKGRWWAWALGVSHPALMGIAVVVTANHYLLDVVVGVIALLGALFLLYAGELLITRLRPRATNG